MTMPRYLILGAGAVGGALGGRLALVGRETVLVARGDHLAALRERGLRRDARLPEALGAGAAEDDVVSRDLVTEPARELLECLLERVRGVVLKARGIDAPDPPPRAIITRDGRPPEACSTGLEARK